MRVEIFDGKVVVYKCSRCISPCLFLREPIRGEERFDCWKGGVILVGEPEKVSK